VEPVEPVAPVTSGVILPLAVILTAITFCTLMVDIYLTKYKNIKIKNKNKIKIKIK